MRKERQGIAVSWCLVVLLGLSGVVAWSADWPQFLGPQRNGVAPGINISTPWPASGLKQLWQREVGEGFAAPVVADGKLYLFHRVGNEEVLEALDPATGKTFWTFKYPTQYRDDFGFEAGPRGTPAVADGVAYIHGADGMVHGVDAKMGAKKWAVDTKSFQWDKAFFGQACSPLVANGLVYLNIGGSPQAGIVALDAATGKTRWTATGDEAGYASPVPAQLKGKPYILFFTREGLKGLDPATGRVAMEYRWRSRSHATVNAASPVVSGDSIFLTASYGTGAVLLDWDGKQLNKVWANDDTLSSHYATPVVYQGHLYGYHGRQEHGQELRAVELRTGKVKWTEPGFGAGTVTLLGDQLLLVREKGEAVLAAANPTGFKPLAKAKLLDGVVRPYPAIADGRLFVRNTKMLGAWALPQAK